MIRINLAINYLYMNKFHLREAFDERTFDVDVIVTNGCDANLQSTVKREFIHPQMKWHLITMRMKMDAEMHFNSNLSRLTWITPHTHVQT